MDRTAIVSTITASSMKELVALRDAERRADLVELRLDGIPAVDVRAALAGRRIPVIVTCRPRWEGGRFDGSEEERHRLLAQAISQDAEYVDVEWRAGFDDLIRSRAGKGIVLSLHEFEGVPADLADVYAGMRSTRAEVVKLAVRAQRLADCLRIADCAPGAARDDCKVVLIAMGPAGVATRVLPSRFGSCWTYAGQAAPGQLPVDVLADEYRVRSQSRSTCVYGLLGSPVAHSVSPSMHNSFFAACGIDAVYVPLQASSIGDFVRFAADGRTSVGGASVTAPFKTEAIGLLARADAIVEQAGAANTLRLDADGWSGTNTDVPALAATLPPGVARGTRAAILGAGGAARAAVEAVRERGGVPTVYTRRAGAPHAFDRFGTPLRQGLPARGSWDLLVNATPVGTYPRADETPLPRSLLSGSVVYDLVYNPPLTRLQREAAAAGCTVVGGLEMLVRQAEMQAEWWTGLRPPEGLMRKAALSALERMRLTAEGEEPER